MSVIALNLDKLYEVSEVSCVEGETIHNMPFVVTGESVPSAILTAHKLADE